MVQKNKIAFRVRDLEKKKNLFMEGSYATFFFSVLHCPVYQKLTLFLLTEITRKNRRFLKPRPRLHWVVHQGLPVDRGSIPPRLGRPSQFL